ncbi:MAG: exodeoxyribonuclease VII small subunit [Oscillospiraceae bacterium]|nr:exodeoxyribonuclease VII small subunit [Oscillospiraceae bacterium]
MAEKKINFEENMKQLEIIVQELEGGKLNLDDSMKKFEEGIKISKTCSDYLEKAEKKIALLVQGKDGELSEENF